MQSSGLCSLSFESGGPAFFCRLGECRTSDEVMSVSGLLERARDGPCRVEEERWYSGRSEACVGDRRRGRRFVQGKQLVQ